MALVLWLGWQGLQPRTMSPWRPAILPLVSVSISLGGIAQSVQPGLAAVGWTVALLMTLPLGLAIGRRRAVRWREDGRLEIAGGWFTLAFALSIFAVRYTLGVLFGILPALRVEPLWIALSGGVGGLVTGIGIGWLAGLLLRARRTALVEA